MCGALLPIGLTRHSSGNSSCALNADFMAGNSLRGQFLSELLNLNNHHVEGVEKMERAMQTFFTDIFFLKHVSSIFRQASNPVCCLSMMAQENSWQLIWTFYRTVHDEYEGPGKRECTTEDPSLCEADTVCCGPRRRQRCS